MDDEYMTVTTQLTPFVTRYKRIGEKFFRLSPLAAAVPNAAYACDFAADGIHQVIGHNITPWMAVYKGDTDTFGVPNYTAALGPSYVKT